MPEDQVGRKIMLGKSSRWTPETKEAAYSLYLTQQFPDIDAISDTLGVPVATLQDWVSKGGWVNKRKAAYSASLEQTFELAVAEINSRRQQALETLERGLVISAAGIEDPDLYFRDKKQALDSARDYIKLAKEIYDTEAPKLMLQEIGKIILEEVQDADAKRRVTERLLALERTGRAS